MKRLIVIGLVLMLALVLFGCVSGPPDSTQDQNNNLGPEPPDSGIPFPDPGTGPDNEPPAPLPI